MSKELEMKICETIERILEEEGKDKIQMFDNANWIGDSMECRLDEEFVKIRYCYYYSYVELIGLSKEDYDKIFEKYGC